MAPTQPPQGEPQPQPQAGTSHPQFIKKKVDSRVRALIDQGVQQRHRSFFVIVGDRGKDQVMYLHYMLSKARVSRKPSVLWCYKKELGFSSHRKKRIRHHQAMVKRGLKDADTEDPFELFISGTDIRYTYYKDSHKVLGQTFGMLVLQDFEALTPNLLARTVETVEGGGVVVLLLHSMKSLTQLYTLTMDVHARYRTQAHADVTARFNERFMLSLGACENCLCVDDELNVLPISVGWRNGGGGGDGKQPGSDSNDGSSAEDAELSELKESLRETQPAGALVQQARTLDQAKAVLTFIDAIADKSLRSTVALTAARGRGKSAALGLAIAAALAYGYANIFVTSPAPENLGTVFQFVFKALEQLGYREHADYDVQQAADAQFNRAIVRVNVFRHHRQTVQYIQPQDAHCLGQAELLVIDEAAAIPLPLVRRLLGNHLVFMASTVNGYEGTGRALSLKLLEQLRRQQAVGSVASTASVNSLAEPSANASKGNATLREIKLSTPIRYGRDDPTERWLNKLLCLDAASSSSSGRGKAAGCPHPNDCQLFAVSRDTLFSYHPVSEAFLQRMMALYVASHYKNSPNDLQLMSDAPAHMLFVLLDTSATNSGSGDSVLPEPLVVLQVCLEGDITRQSVRESLRRGRGADGDMIPWTVAQQFQDDDFATLSGARIVRIASHPDYARMGYGTRAMQLLVKYFESGGDADINSIQPSNVMRHEQREQQQENHGDSLLHSERLHVRDAATMPPLLLSLEEVPAPRLHWLGVAYGLTGDLLRFWRRHAFTPVYLRQTANDLTGEHTCIMLRRLASGASGDSSSQWLRAFSADFKQRFLQLLAFPAFRQFSPLLCMLVVDAVDQQLKGGSGSVDSSSVGKPLCRADVDAALSAYDLKRLQSYANNQLDYHVIMDLLPTLAGHYFSGRMRLGPTVGETSDVINSNTNKSNRDISLSAVQKAILVGVALQRRTMDELAAELQLPVSQLLALFVRSMRKISEFYESLVRADIERDIATEDKNNTDDAKIDSTGAEIKSEVSSTNNNSKRRVDDEEAWDPVAGAETMADELEAAGQQDLAAKRQRQRDMISALNLSQYAITADAAGWDEALDGVKKGGSNTLLSVRTEHSAKQKKRQKHANASEEVAKLGAKLADAAKSKKTKKSSSSSKRA